MKRRILSFLLAFCLVFTFISKMIAVASDSRTRAMAGIEISSQLPSLKEIYKDHFAIGNVVHFINHQKFPGVSSAPVLLHHYNLLVDFNFNSGNIEMINEKGLLMRLPALICMVGGGSQSNIRATHRRSEALQIMTDQINSTVEQYSGQSVYWLVVNEAMTWNGSANGNFTKPTSWREALNRESEWYKTFARGADTSKDESGADYIEMAFRLARQADPNAILYYNDYNLDYPDKAVMVAEMVKEINDKWRAEGNKRLLIEGIGMQGHYNVGEAHETDRRVEYHPTDIVNLERSIRRFINLGVQVSITELDVSLFGWWEDNVSKVATQEKLERQATFYARLMQVLKKHSSHIRDVTFWGLEDKNGDAWLTDDFPRLFDEFFYPKLAYFAVADPEGYLAGNFNTAEKRQAWINANTGGTPSTPTLPPSNNALDTATSWAREGLTIALAKGFVPSDLQSNYQSTITRAEFCRLAVKWVEFKTGKTIDAVMAENGVSRNPNAFTDTNDANILSAFALGITSGVGNNRFDPNGSFTREQASGMILNVGKVIGINTSNIPPSGFADMSDVSPWCVDGVNFCFENGIMQGTGNNRFSPKDPFTREQSILTFNNIQ